MTASQLALSGPSSNVCPLGRSVSLKQQVSLQRQRLGSSSKVDRWRPQSALHVLCGFCEVTARSRPLRAAVPLIPNSDITKIVVPKGARWS